MANNSKLFIDKLISKWLKLGVYTALLLSVIGGFLLLKNQNLNASVSYSVFKSAPLLNFDTLTYGLLNGNGDAYILASIIFLVATPLIRIVLAGIGFLIEKDYLYATISLIIISIIIFGMIHDLH
jgi:uncharacterized membrane protein